MSGLAETAAEQQDLVASVLLQAEACLRADAAVASALGSTISVGSPFQQSSSSTSINGQTTVRVELALPVGGSRADGVARVVASGRNKEEATLQLLEVQVNGRVIPVSTTAVRRSSSSSRFTSSSSSKTGDDDIIEAEIIEEKRNKR